ncbi:MAG: glutamate ABC transporter substrate-binding protein [Candidatus Gastranaerophilales bacterium]|nr:glutamate ABC transporter substrate-binding protein [Candidatus Gastranaerophilales bacterium]
MKKIIRNFGLLMIGITLFSALTACKSESQKTQLEQVRENNKIVVGVKYDSKPFGFIDQDQQLKGFDIDLSREIAKRILGDEKTVEFKQVTSSNRIFALTSNGVDFVAATMTINDKRERVVNFSQPYHVAGQAIMVPKNSIIANVKDLNGKNVGVVLGSTSERNLRNMAPRAFVKGYRTYTDAFSALKTGRIDALTTDDTILTGFLYEDDNFKILNHRYTKEPYGLAFRKSEDSISFQDIVNAALEDIKADGTLKKLQNKWLSIQ